MSLPSVFLTAAACLLTLLTATAEPEKALERRVRFLPVGDSPPFVQEIRDGVSYEIDPPLDSEPPRQIVPGFGKETTGAVGLHLGRISAPATIPGGEGTLDLRRAGAAPDAASWHSLKRPESGDFLVYLFRSPKQRTWNEATSLVVPDGAAGWPPGTLRIVNLYPIGVRIVWNGQPATLLPGKSVLHPIQPGTEVPFQILVADAAGALKRYYSGSVTQNPGERGLVTIYRADSENPRRPVKVLMLREPAAEPPPPKDKK